MTRKQRRISLLIVASAVLTVAAGLVLSALEESIVFFRSPTDIIEKKVEVGTRIRLGGLVEEGSIQRGEGLTVSFKVTDLAATVPVTYTGILPDLFREAQGVVTEGRLDDSGIFRADTVLAKHDENYMPSEVADSLKAAGMWKDGKPVTDGSQSEKTE
ncbi:Cytochrome c-type biogenesis protein CcmE, heme chaperone [hydrothermal vent metagenome]|uniref:Cytochrome c-type biogenesis protein CcmE, heme chaperone n=1 Tax=hydrothermal vent metagenome TaxID=652676 RepID=A0A3B0THQ3_9ZZZZ